MIDLYTWSTPNGRKVSIMLEECGLDYAAHPVDISKDEQFKPDFLKISPNNRIPAIIDRDNGRSLFESGAILLYLADKTGKFMPKDKDGYWLTMQWLMWQMGGVGPMIGQVHHFLRNAKGKAPYAEERYIKEAHRLYGVLDKRLARGGVHGRRLFHRRHGDLALDLALRVAPGRHRQVSQRAALVQGDRGAAGGREGLSHSRQAAGHPHAGLRPFPIGNRSGEGSHMPKDPNFSGVIAPVLTPFGEDGGPDAERFVEHCQWLMAEGCTGLAPFGTTSEGNSLGVDERMELLEELVDDGMEAGQADARHRHLLARRRHRADQARRGSGLRRRADAAALLLQGAERGGALPLLRAR